MAALGRLSPYFTPMNTTPTPTGTHPTITMLLLLGDVATDADAVELIESLQNDAASGTSGPDDSFSPATVRTAWTHVQSCSWCGTRRRALSEDVSTALRATPAGTAASRSLMDRQVRAAVAELVPNPGAQPPPLTRASRRRRWFGRGAVGGGIGRSSSDGAVARPWAAGIALSALVLAVVGAIALRPRTAEQSAVGTVPAAVATANTAATETEAASAQQLDQGSGSVLAAEAQPAPEQESGEAMVAVPAPPADPTPAVDSVEPAAPITTAASMGAPGAQPPGAPVAKAVPETATREGDGSPPPPNQARTVPDASTPAPQPARKKSVNQPDPAGGVAASAASGGSRQDPPNDLGGFDTAEAALERFAERYPTVSGASAQQRVPPAPPIGPITTLFTGSPSGAAQVPLTAPLGAETTPAPGLVDDARCPGVLGSPRVAARVGQREILLIRLSPPAGIDIVVDAVTCMEIARRSATMPSTATTLPPPNTTTSG